ncbi:MAG TPA: pyridoxal phosphate-dependent aminotransferase [Candidatus Lokiarchaeia archaeon]|nr:pyridoxal phosphate-dependent aminotransferase [Candidatus Lokiarchaeia archaeon]
MKPLSAKLAGVPKSSIRKMFDMLGPRTDLISLGIGQPDFKTPQPVIDATIAALQEGKGSIYAPTTGILRLKQVLAEKLKKENGIDVEVANIMITNGGSGSIALAFGALFNPGDELLMFSPNFLSYYYVARYVDAKVIETPRRSDFGPDIDQLAKRVTSKTKAILINSPNNPTGYTYTRQEIEDVAAICMEHDLYLISDEVYEKMLYDGNEHVSPASLEGMAERVVTLNAASKTLSLTGFRIGYLCAPEPMLPLMENYIQYTAAGANHPCQYGVLAGMEYVLENPAYLDEIIAAYQHKRDTCYTRLNEMGLSCNKPGGAFYIMPDISVSGMDGDTFAQELVEKKGVAVVTGSAFGQYSKNHVRISYALDDQLLSDALDRMEQFVQHL